MRAAAAGGFGPRDPIGRKSTALIHRPNHSGSACHPSPILGNSSSARPPRAAKASLRPRTAILRIALLALSFNCSPPAVSATSSDELQPAAWGGGELHGSKSRNCTTSFVAPILSGSSCGVRPGHRRCPAASPAARRTAKATPFSDGFGLSPTPPSGKAAGRTGRRFCESRYSLSYQIPAQSSSPCSAQRSTKTVSGFRARRTIAAQSPAQFSVPCPPHCGSACAPPLPLST